MFRSAVLMSNPGSELTVTATKSVPLEWLKQRRSVLSSGFVRNVMETYATRILLMGIALFTTILVARLLGPEGRGMYAVATAVGALGVQFGNLGLHTANVYCAARDPETLPYLIGNTLLVGLGVGATLAGAAGAVLLFAPNLISLRGTILLLALLWIPIGLTYLLTQDLLLGVHDVRAFNLLEVANKTIPVVLMIIIALTHRVTVASLFATTVLAIALCLVSGLGTLTRKRSLRPRVSLQVLRRGFRYALKTYLVTLFAFLVFRADLFLVQHILGPTQTGYYSIAYSMADPVWMLAGVVGTILLPTLSAVSDVQVKLHLTRRAVLGVVFSLLPLLLLASILVGPVIHFLFGDAFLPAKTAFLALMPGMLLLGVEAVAVQFLNSIGCPTALVWLMGLCAVFNIIANLWAIPRYGILVASVVSSVTYFLACAFVLWLVWRYRHHLPSPAENMAGSGA